MTWTPWGKSDSSDRYAPGIVWYNTPSHGGFHLSPTINACIPEYMRNKDGWYEEDCDWCIVAILFPGALIGHDPDIQKTLKNARDTFRNWLPDAYERYFGVTLKSGESYIRDHPVPPQGG